MLIVTPHAQYKIEIRVKPQESGFWSNPNVHQFTTREIGKLSCFDTYNIILLNIQIDRFQLTIALIP